MVQQFCWGRFRSGKRRTRRSHFDEGKFHGKSWIQKRSEHTLSLRVCVFALRIADVGLSTQNWLPALPPIPGKRPGGRHGRVGVLHRAIHLLFTRPAEHTCILAHYGPDYGMRIPWLDRSGWWPVLSKAFPSVVDDAGLGKSGDATEQRQGNEFFSPASDPSRTGTLMECGYDRGGLQ